MIAGQALPVAAGRRCAFPITVLSRSVLAAAPKRLATLSHGDLHVCGGVASLQARPVTQLNRRAYRITTQATAVAPAATEQIDKLLMTMKDKQCAWASTPLERKIAVLEASFLCARELLLTAASEDKNRVQRGCDD